LTNKARAVFQLYPENMHQCELIIKAAQDAGFKNPGYLVDYPNRYEYILQ
jgi:hypothetical protein